MFGKKELLPNKRIEEIQELKDIDLDEDLTYKDLPFITRMIYIVPTILGLLFLWGITLMFVYTSTLMTMEDGKIAIIIIATFLVIVSLLCTKRLLTSKMFKKSGNSSEK